MTDLKIIDPLETLRARLRKAFEEQRWDDVAEICKLIFDEYKSTMTQIEIDRVAYARNKAKMYEGEK